MDLFEIIELLKRRWLTIVSVFLLTIGAGFAALALLPAEYESTATLGLTPSARAGENPLLLLGQIDVISPLYAEAATAFETRRAARTLLPPGARLGEISVRTFRDAPLVLKLSVRSDDPEVAQTSAEAHVEALIRRAVRGEVGTPGLIEILVIDSPVTPDEPVWPRPKLVLLVAGVLGLGLGVGAAFLRDRTSRTLDSAELVADAVGAPVFGEVPVVRSIATVTSTAEFQERPELRLLGESLRDVRTNLQFAVSNLSTVLVTSPEGHHGKTTLSFALAITLAKSGARTLLVDGDLRRGRIEMLFASETTPARKSPGLADVLKGADPGEVIQPTDIPTLSVLTSGHLESNPDELLESNFFSVLYRLEQLYDVVIIDGTPLLPVNDARIVARYTTATLVTVAEGASNRRDVRAAVDRLRMIDVEPTAAVFNKSRSKRSSSYYLTPARVPT